LTVNSGGLHGKREVHHLHKNLALVTRQTSCFSVTKNSYMTFREVITARFGACVFHTITKTKSNYFPERHTTAFVSKVAVPVVTTVLRVFMLLVL
jgi:hypothetical protein